MLNEKKIIDILDQFEIPYWTEGKNVTQGWINITCPFCSDHSNHLGISKESLLFNCWRCGTSGPFVNLLIELTGLSFKECLDIVSESDISFQKSAVDQVIDALREKPLEVEVDKVFDVVLPKEFEFVTDSLNFPLLDSYLERRNVARSTLIEYVCGVCRGGQYMNRLIIPVVCQGKVVSFQAADLQGTAELKYRSAPISMGAINNYLYGYDEIDKRMIVVEGILDKWRVGREAVAAFTSTITEEQEKLIRAKNLDELYFCFDGESVAYTKAIKVAARFKADISTVAAVPLPIGKDPDELSQEEIYRCIAKI